MDKKLAELVSCAEVVLQENWGTAVRLGDVDRLTASDRRNLLVRCKVLDGPAEAPESVMIKRARLHKYDPDDPKSRAAIGLFRDWAGLQFLSGIDDGQLASPTFHGGDREAGFFIMEDLGSGNDVDHALTCGCAELAERALLMLAKALGRMHAASAGREQEYQELRDALGPGDSQHRLRLADHAREFAPALMARFEALDVEISSQFMDSIECVANAMADPGPFLTYTHADPCPDNCIVAGDRVRLFDFEFGSFRHALLDGVYGRVRFPTCWCVRDIPESVVSGMESVYRDELIRGCPAAADDAMYHRAVADASAYWMLENLASLFDRALQYEEPKGTATNRQRILTRMSAFCEVADRAGHIPGMLQTFERLLAALKDRWIDNMPLYDAFSQASELGDEDVAAFVDAIDAEDLARIGELLEGDPGLANAKVLEADQTPVLYRAVDKKNSELVKLLLASGADWRITTRTGWTTLSRAVAHSTPEIVGMLLDAGAELNQRDMWSSLPLYGCLGNEQMKAYLLQRGAQIDLKFAIDINQIALVEHLLKEKPARARGRYGTGITLLHDSARVGDSRIEAMKLLLEHDADVNAQSNWDATPLHLAAFNGNVETVRLLLEYGADPSIEDHRGCTSFVLADGKGHGDCAELLRPDDATGPAEVQESSDRMTGMPAARPVRSDDPEGSGSTWLELFVPSKKPVDVREIEPGETATIRFWRTASGQKLIQSLNQPGVWLSTEFPNLYGPSAHEHSLADKTNEEIARHFEKLIKRNKKAAPFQTAPKLEARVLAVALSVFVTTESLGGDASRQSGFVVTKEGVGAASINVGENGSIFAVRKNTWLTVREILDNTNRRARDGQLYDRRKDSDQQLIIALRTLADRVYTSLLEAGNI